mmetsp:Transcript_37347/g.48319  ORF Transcript_37347/g.48319 Transcript_37347/m.48319 type:complete len:93 (+) Transcript_37347:611-889(+)
MAMSETQNKKRVVENTSSLQQSSKQSEESSKTLPKKMPCFELKAMSSSDSDSDSDEEMLPKQDSEEEEGQQLPNCALRSERVHARCYEDADE